MLAALGCEISGTSGSPARRSEPIYRDEAVPVYSAAPAEGMERYDQRFLLATGQDSLNLVVLSRLAAEKATDSKVKELAGRLRNDHTQLNERMMAIAKAKGIKLAHDLDKRREGQLASLKKMTAGVEWDKAYLNAVIADLSTANASFHDAARTAADPDVRVFAVRQEPGLRDRLRAAKALRDGDERSDDRRHRH